MTSSSKEYIVTLSYCSPSNGSWTKSFESNQLPIKILPHEMDRGILEGIVVREKE